MTDRQTLERWIAYVRLAAVPFGIVQVALTTDYPEHYELYAWLLVAGLGVGAVGLYVLVRRSVTETLRVVAMLFDFAIVSGFTLLFAFEFGTPTRQLLFIAIVLGAARFGLSGGIAVALAAVPVSAWFEERRSDFFQVDYRIDYVTFQAGAGVLMALVVGWMYTRLAAQTVTARQQALEAEALRDELGRRADVLDAANRCARALSSSLDLDEAFGAFIRELRGLLRFERMSIVLSEDGVARVMAAAGRGAQDVLPAGTQLDPDETILTDVIARGQTIYRADLREPSRYVEEAELLRSGIRSRVLAPLLTGARANGLISIGRAEANAFEPHEIELVSLLGRLAASAIQNIRAFESERRTVDELRRLSTMRADFVSLVSHELRSPMASVIGAARTLQIRWRELQPEQREAFLALIGDETSRLAALVGDVLDTSRIDAGTFTYRFDDVDLGLLVTDSVATAELGQDEVPVRAEMPPKLPPVRGDAARLRQVLANLIDNAVKYSPAGQPVEVRVVPVDRVVHISVNDRGPGVKPGDQRMIFEKFGRAVGSGSKPGTGLGLYIARSIAEAHGGELTVSSAPGRGATFTLSLPA
ncbi:MAG TPA: ATP-binding protein [Gaiellaceae bacterium]|nr:ATP-binding protein [Gaiellaceae bacterium]